MPEKRWVIEGESFRARKALWPNGKEDRPGAWICPYCKSVLAHNMPFADIIQFGFEWDTHTTLMQCDGCGRLMYGTYNIWLTTKERKKRHA